MCTCGARRRWGSMAAKYFSMVAEEAAQVLDEPVEQRGEVQRVPRGPLVVVGGQVSQVASWRTRPQ